MNLHIAGRTRRWDLLAPYFWADFFAKQETIEETFVDLPNPHIHQHLEF